MNERPIKSDLPKVDRLTDETIGYTDIPALDAAFLSKAVRVPSPTTPSEAPAAAPEVAPVATAAQNFTATLLPGDGEGASCTDEPSLEPHEIQGFERARHRGFEPLTYGSGVQGYRRFSREMWPRDNGRSSHVVTPVTDGLREAPAAPCGT
jgi:hypothetical protein